MESRNPYQPPSADISEQDILSVDQSSVFSPSGRFGRLSYIAWGVVVGVVSNLITTFFAGSDPDPSDVGAAPMGVLIVISLATLGLYAIFSIRRCHDFNGSGWWVLLGLIPLINLFFLLNQR